MYGFDSNIWIWEDSAGRITRLWYGLKGSFLHNLTFLMNSVQSYALVIIVSMMLFQANRHVQLTNFRKHTNFANFWLIFIPMHVQTMYNHLMHEYSWMINAWRSYLEAKWSQTCIVGCVNFRKWCSDQKNTKIGF